MAREKVVIDLLTFDSLFVCAQECFGAKQRSFGKKFQPPMLRYIYWRAKSDIHLSVPITRNIDRLYRHDASFAVVSGKVRNIILLSRIEEVCR